MLEEVGGSGGALRHSQHFHLERLSNKKKKIQKKRTKQTHHRQSVKSGVLEMEVFGDNGDGVGPAVVA